jgi:hypothetical protein
MFTHVQKQFRSINGWSWSEFCAVWQDLTIGLYKRWQVKVVLSQWEWCLSYITVVYVIIGNDRFGIIIVYYMFHLISDLFNRFHFNWTSCFVGLKQLEGPFWLIKSSCLLPALCYSKPISVDQTINSRSEMPSSLVDTVPQKVIDYFWDLQYQIY